MDKVTLDIFRMALLDETISINTETDWKAPALNVNEA